MLGPCKAGTSRAVPDGDDRADEYDAQPKQYLGGEIRIGVERQFSPVIQQDDTSFALLKEGSREMLGTRQLLEWKQPKFRAART